MTLITKEFDQKRTGNCCELFGCVSTKNSVRFAFINTPIFFFFLLGLVAAEVRRRGVGVSGHSRYSGPEKIRVSTSDFISNSLLITQHSTEVCIGSIRDRRGRGREAK